MNLTEVKFWDDYWANCKLPNKIDFSISFERCLAMNLKILLADCNGDVLEIGCAPGEWLVFLSGELGLKPSGIEYSSVWMLVTKKIFEMLDLSYGNIWSGDFFQLPPTQKFDVVMSLGFIEHFSNADEVIERHLQWLKPEGTLVLGVQNFCGINKPIQSALDHSVLEKHNTEIMNIAYSLKLGELLNLKPKFIEYIGSFEPDLFIVPNIGFSLKQYGLRGLL
jgi:2-polyprenyl-3-methyl-5-hydroxy-6-metoxy-1,4-benzoquinol methylase